ncbi:hypothetical protein BJF83_17295 [Nocardiopsis sp. CNR-923]|uniref:phage tail assembly protein n=1 Tax=Nocardiopsis sp. CNR-923 TaxID=1904965 RepID=UPI00095B1F9C|nr:phage tail assembly protein [Nocardiopsis sp. CNR-923]OLT27742.1 hypothetical protein BJF83_17295 [Nocardiopsis sp. CNR-923]
MSTIDVSDLQDSAPEPTVVKLKGRTITLRPLLEVGAEHDETLVELIEQLGNLTPARKSDGEEGGGRNMEEIRAMMPLANKILFMAAPTNADGDRLLKLPLSARFRILMSYVEDQQLGEAFPSGS